MEKELLEKITETVEGYPVKNLTYKKVDNIIVGQVKDPYTLFPDLHGGWETCVWNKSGFPQKFNKGRKELILKM